MTLVPDVLPESMSYKGGVFHTTGVCVCVSYTSVVYADLLRIPTAEQYLFVEDQILNPNLSGTESRIENHTIPRIAGLESPDIPRREEKDESNRNKEESRKSNSESPSESHPINA